MSSAPWPSYQILAPPCPCRHPAGCPALPGQPQALGPPPPHAGHAGRGLLGRALDLCGGGCGPAAGGAGAAPAAEGGAAVRVAHH
eukprot:1151981-Pelagomonas_calceolata.AAC.5